MPPCPLECSLWFGGLRGALIRPAARSRPTPIRPLGPQDEKENKDEPPKKRKRASKAKAAVRDDDRGDNEHMEDVDNDEEE